MENNTVNTTVINPEELLQHWQGHRALTRRMIEAFPEHELYNFSLGGMRPFSELARELMGLAGVGIHGIVKNDWNKIADLDYTKPGAKTKNELLGLWDKVTEDIERLWPQLTSERFHEIVLAFGQFEGPVWGAVFYWIDNENHHRGQGYVYLRALGIEPPPFWDR